MKALIIIPKLNGDSRYKDYNYIFPLGFAYLATTLEREDIEVDALNLNHHDGRAIEILKRQSNLNCYDLILSGGLQGLFLQISDIFSYLKETTNATLIVGGGLLADRIQEIFPTLHAHFGIQGEGEVALAKFIKCYCSHKKFSEVPSLIYYENETLKINLKERQIQNIDSVPLPNFDVLDYRNYLQHIDCNANFYSSLFDNPRIYPIQSSRGCEYLCTFCVHTVGSKYVLRSINSIMDELRINVIKYKINIITFIDSLIGTEKDRILELCRQISILRNEISWDCRWQINLMASILDPPLIDALIESGCFMLSLGFESYNSNVLKSMHKAITPAIIHKTTNLVHANKIAMQSNFIFGDIAEDRKSFKQSLDYIKTQAKGQIDLFCITPSVGSELFESLLKNNSIKNALSYLLNLSVHYRYKGIHINIRPPKMNYIDHHLATRNVFTYSYKYNYHAIVKKFSNSAITFKCPSCNKIMTYSNINMGSRYRFHYFTSCRNCLNRILILSKTYWFIIHFIPFHYEIWRFFTSLKIRMEKLTLFVISKNYRFIRRKSKYPSFCLISEKRKSAANS